ncbi:YhdT family protein [Nocardiopsis ansamitocini]|uniref:DUF997 family protein n=1 Tax=Nocardiopsis ansamitocini TaxID=1670832 RepID=A0A9W6PBK1_9ACTN|nr:YhdT family protein [Nocardiopsis ansamitocini]GLU50513.1 hypothetical protein Nans01_48640 [Nocardiopsis ansamitocini]
MSDTEVTSPEASFEEDPRYRVAGKELMIALGYWLAFTVTVTATAWILGGNKSADELTFILGFPTWFFWSVPVTCFAFSAIAYFLVHRYFTDVPLSADGGEPAEPAER